LRRLQRFFLTGIIVILPAAATIYLLAVTFNFLDRLAGNLVVFLFGKHLPGVGLAIMIFTVLAAGFLTTNIAGRFLLNLWDKFMCRIPLANSIYRTLKQVVDTICHDEKKAFKRVVMIEYPRKGIYSLGFLTGPATAEANMRAEKDLVNVFIPTTPNPTSGFLLMVPVEDIIPLDISIEDSIKLIISAGVIGPGAGNKAAVNVTSWNELLKSVVPDSVINGFRRRDRGIVQ